MLTAEQMEEVGPVTTEEYFAMRWAQGPAEAKLMLAEFRRERAEMEALCKQLREHADPKYTGMSDEYRRLLNAAAAMIEMKEANIALLRGMVAGMEHNDALAL